MNTKKPSFALNLINDTQFRGLASQVLVIILIIAAVWWVIDNTIANLAAQSKSVGFGFLTQSAGFQISDTVGTWLVDYEAGKSTYLDVYFIGIINTFVVAFMGIILATILGFLIGIMRLSSNFVLRSFATCYVELLRNTPLLLQMFFWYFAVLSALPDRRSKIEIIPDIIGVNITGLYAPAPVFLDGFFSTVVAFCIAVVLTIIVSRFIEKRRERTGQILPKLWIGFGILFGLPLVVFLMSGSPLTWENPVFKQTGSLFQRGYQSGSGMLILTELLAVWLALSLYTAAFIAEIVRAGIQAVAKSQTEASLALGLKPNRVLQLVVIPQAMRVIIPPLTSQYLNLTKNSSLAVFIAYPELVAIFAGTALNQVGKELEMIFMMMSVYLTFSIITAMFMNWFNARVKLVER